MMRDVSVVIPQWNREALLEQALQSIQRQEQAPREIIVVDNGSTDGSVACARAHGATVLELGANYGFARAVNEGWKRARSQWVLVLNNDVWLESGFLNRLADAAERQGCWFAAPCLINSQRRDVLDGAFDLLSRGGTAWRAGHGEPREGIWLEPRRIFFPPLTAALLRRELLEKVGSLDERFGSYLEDVDFGLRCALQGLHGVYVPDAVAQHAGSATLGAWSKEMVRLIARNQVLLVAKHYPRGWVSRYGWPVAVAQLLWGTLAMRHGCGWAWFRGKFEGLKLSGAIRVPADPERLSEVLEESERQLRELSRDSYWRMYFRLAG